MAACPTCHREMLLAHTCRIRLGAVRYGSERVVPDPYPDCGVSAGVVHHPGCCLEECRGCGDQALGCGCTVLV